MIDLQELEKYKENNRIEAKRALGGLPRSIWETYSAFANTLGGIILLGVEEHRDRSLHPVDLPDPEGLIREFEALLNDPEAVSANILSPGDITVERIGGCRTVAIRVPRARQAQRPVYVGGDPICGSYRRRGEGDCKCPKNEVYAMLLEADRAALLLKENDADGELKVESLSEAYQKSIVEHLTAHVTADAATLAGVLGISPAHIKYLLHELIIKGVVVAVGAGRDRIYKLK